MHLSPTGIIVAVGLALLVGLGVTSRPRIGAAKEAPPIRGQLENEGSERNEVSPDAEATAASKLLPGSHPVASVVADRSYPHELELPETQSPKAPKVGEEWSSTHGLRKSPGGEAKDIKHRGADEMDSPSAEEAPEILVELPAGLRSPVVLGSGDEDLPAVVAEEKERMAEKFEREVVDSLKPGATDAPDVWRDAQQRADDHFRLMFGKAMYDQQSLKMGRKTNPSASGR